ncbi:hypothetical protein [Paracoccus sediminilitoris]|uniref:hypothetical protein n=1 Tax=Paracoccus sediminilitoris TaxID=2202419 RepID=UPI00272C2B94|nr:hypothetical protein [Paracoccus sediminilitoris]
MLKDIAGSKAALATLTADHRSIVCPNLKQINLFTNVISSGISATAPCAVSRRRDMPYPQSIATGFLRLITPIGPR